MLRHRIACGVARSPLQKQSFAEPNLNFRRAYDLVVSFTITKVIRLSVIVIQGKGKNYLGKNLFGCPIVHVIDEDSYNCRTLCEQFSSVISDELDERCSRPV